VSHTEDRWFITAEGPDGKPVKRRTARHGKGRRWRARYLDPDGKERSRSFHTKIQAEKFLTEIEHAKIAGTYRDPDAGRITLRKYVTQTWLPAQGFDPVTREAVESRLANHVLPEGKLGSRLLSELEARPSLVQAWVTGLNLAPSTAAKVFTHLGSIMIAAQTDGLIERNPCRAGIKLPKGARRKLVPWAPAQAAAVRASLPARLRAMVDAGKGLGLRQSELFGLSVEEIEFMPGRAVHVRQQVKIVGRQLWFAPPKGGVDRRVPMAGRTSLVLSAHIAQFACEVTLPWHEPGTRRHGKPHTATLLFTTPDGRALHRNAFNEHVWKPARGAAGLSDDRVNGCHMLRHVYASNLLARNVDPRTVAEHMGHSDGGALVLRVYGHLMPDAEDRTRRALDEALGEDGAPSEDHGPGTAQESGEGS
jgi:integrase